MIMLSKLIKPSMQCLKLVKIFNKDSISILKRGMARNCLVKNPTQGNLDSCFSHHFRSKETSFGDTIRHGNKGNLELIVLLLTSSLEFKFFVIANVMAQVKPLGTCAWNYNECQ